MSAEQLSFPFARPPEYGAPLEVVPGIYWLRMPLPFALDHINLWLLRDGHGWTIVDTGIGSDSTRGHWENVFGTLFEDGFVTQLIVTHHHPDHAGNADWLAQRWGVPVMMTGGEFLAAHVLHASIGGWDRTRGIELYAQHGVAAAMVERQRARGNGYPKLVPSLPGSFVRLVDGDEVEIDGRAWRVIVGHGHTMEHAALYCADLGVLISGDQVLPRITTNVSVWPDQPEADPLKRFVDSMSRYEPLPADTLVLPSHDRVFRGLHARLAMLRSHHAQRLEEVRSACSQARTAAEIVPVLFKRELDDHQFMFAIGETLAHLNHLWHRGALQRIADAEGQYQFIAAP
jgi:glyoxylase-like metal-dependent hydrolase (beta-lactamase superfamily II)